VIACLGSFWLGICIDNDSWHNGLPEVKLLNPLSYSKRALKPRPRWTKRGKVPIGTGLNSFAHRSFQDLSGLLPLMVDRPFFPGGKVLNGTASLVHFEHLEFRMET
jgi:hypothetical protein